MSKKILTKQTKISSARRYQELLTIANNTLNLSEIYSKHIENPYENNNQHIIDNYLKLTDSQANKITYDYSIDTLEGFINHLGYILDKDWQNYEKKHFQVQFDRLRSIFNKFNIDIDIPSIDRSPRNNIHHIHPSEHDISHKVSEEIYDPTLPNGFNAYVEMETSWAPITFSDAKNALDTVTSFIDNTRNFLQSKDIGDIGINDEKRKILLKDFLENKENYSMHHVELIT